MIIMMTVVKIPRTLIQIKIQTLTAHLPSRHLHIVSPLIVSTFSASLKMHSQPILIRDSSMSCFMTQTCVTEAVIVLQDNKPIFKQVIINLLAPGFKRSLSMWAAVVAVNQQLSL